MLCGSPVWRWMSQPCYWLSTAFITDQGCSSAELDVFQGTESLSKVLKCFKYQCGHWNILFEESTSILGNGFFIRTCAPNSSRGICLKAGDRLFLRCLLTACRLFPMTWFQRFQMTQNQSGYRLTLLPISIPCLPTLGEYSSFLFSLIGL